MNTFGDNVKRLREAKGLSQDELAKMAGYTSRSTISCIESGKRDCTQKQILALANALNVSPGELFDNKENCAPQDKRKAQIHKIERLLSQLNEENLNNAIQYLAFLASSQDKQ